ncbi:MAG: DUF2141 domain-containing protein [Planctomycetota bacterium]
MPPLNDRTEVRERMGLRRAWQESHGNLLLGFAGVILVAGLILIWKSPDEPEVALGLDGEQILTEPPLPPNALLIRISSDIDAAGGPIRIAIYDSEEAFGDVDKALMKDAMKPVEGFVVWEVNLDALPIQFGVAAYHDLDDNGELNRGMLNAPVEPYGFSNNARSLVGPPSYSETLVDKPESSEMIEIRVR